MLGQVGNASWFVSEIIFGDPTDVFAFDPLTGDITGTAGLGVIRFLNNGANVRDTFQVEKNPVAAQAGDGIQVTMGAFTTGVGVRSISPDRVSFRAEGGAVEFSASAAAVSAANEGRFKYDLGTQQIMMSLNGGAYMAIGAAGATSLDGAYDFGGAGAGRAITVDAGAVTLTNNAVNNTNVLEVTKNPVGAQSGIGILVTMGAQATGVGVSSVSPNLVSFRADTGAYEGSAATTGVSAANEGRLRYDLALQHWVVSENGGAYVAILSMGMITLDTAYDGGTAGSGNGRAVTVDAGAITLTNNGANNTNVLEITKAPAGAQTGSGLVIAMTPGAAAAATGMTVTMGANTSAAGFAALFDWRGTAGTTVPRGIVNIEVGAATILTGRLCGLAINLTDNVTGGANQLCCLRMMSAATTRANTAAEGSIVLVSQSTAMRTMDLGIMNTSGTLCILRYWSATVLAGAIVGWTIDLATLVTHNAQVITGLLINGAATTAASAAGQGLLVLDNLATLARTVDGGHRTTGGTVVLWRYTAATNLAAAIILQDIDGTTNVTAAAFSVIGLRVQIPVTTRANTAAEGAIVVLSAATRATALDLGVLQAGDTIAKIRYTGATVLAAATIGWDIDLFTNVTANGQNITGLRITTAATNVGGNNAALIVDSRATGGLVADFLTATLSGLSFRVRYSSAVVLGGAVVGALIDISTAVHNGQQATALKVQTTDTTAAQAAGIAAFVVISSATLQFVTETQVLNTGGTLFHTIYGGAQTLSSALIGYDLDLTTNVTHGAQSITGFRFVGAATTIAGAAGQGALVLLPLATRMRAIDCGVRITGSIGVAFRWAAATVLGAATQCFSIDAQTNLTPGALTLLGINMLIGATSAADSGGILITTTQTGGGSAVYEAVITPAAPAVVHGYRVSGNASWTGIGLIITQDASIRATSANSQHNGCSVFYNAGAPNNANGANGDYYFRTDAAAANAAIFVRIAGTWTAI